MGSQIQCHKKSLQLKWQKKIKKVQKRGSHSILMVIILLELIEHLVELLKDVFPMLAWFIAVSMG